MIVWGCKMAVVNRPVIGTVKCFTQGCDETATVHQVQKGARKGELYTRCPACGCNQSRGALFQSYLVGETEFRPDAAELLPIPGAVMKPETQAETQAEQVSDPGETQEEAQPEPEPETAPETRRRPGGKIVLAGLGITGLITLAIGLTR